MTVGTAERYRSGWRTYLSSRGNPYRVWETAMPYIAPPYLNCALYLYHSRADAENGSDTGGSGFLVGIESEVVPNRYHLYAVTADHVRHRSPVVRLNITEDEVEVFDLLPEHWIPHAGGDDVAVCPLDLIPSRSSLSIVVMDEMLTEDLIRQERIGQGDNCFMVGRLIGHDGKQRNKPVLRFGNIAMMQGMVDQPNRGREQESFLVEMRSKSGFSGSAVFVYFETVGTRPIATAPPFVQPQRPSTVVNQAWLLGLDWGGGDPPVAAVAPAWKLIELLNQEEVVVARKQREEELAKKWGSPEQLKNTQQTNTPATSFWPI